MALLIFRRSARLRYVTSCNAVDGAPADYPPGQFMVNINR